MNNRVRKLITFGIALSGGMFSSVHAQEGQIAEVVDSVVASTLSTYTKVVEKLRQDGTGASADYSTKKGFVPPTDDFMRKMAFNTLFANKRSGEKQLGFSIKAGRLVANVEEESLTDDQRALIVAKVVDGMIRSVRSTYTSEVVKKLKRDGAGASPRYTSQRGFVPLPAVFVRQVASDVDTAQSGEQWFAMSLRSRWNLNRRQGLQGRFDHEGWEFLAAQQQARLASGQSLEKYTWEPYTKVMTLNGKKTLRYLSADPAADVACVACHNKWESKAEVQSVRESQGVEVGKVFKKHELMGALSITVPLAN